MNTGIRPTTFTFTQQQLRAHSNGDKVIYTSNTTLNAAITAGNHGSITVTSTDGFPSKGYITIGAGTQNEDTVAYTSTTPTTSKNKSFITDMKAFGNLS